MSLENYEGSISLISGIKQANNGTFPLVDASAVQVDNTDKRLDAALAEKVDKEDVVNDLTGDLTGKVAGASVVKAVADAIPSNSDLIQVTDLAGNFEATNVEGVLSEIGTQLNDYATLEDRLSEQIYNAIRSVSTPDGFSWTNHPLVGKLFRSSGIQVNFDARSMYEPAGITYYVNAYGGNDSNDGLSQAAPLLKLSTALDKPDVGEIIIDGWRMPANYTPSTSLRKSVRIRGALGSPRPLITTHSAVTWTLVPGKTKTYQTTKEGAYRVVDVGRLDDKGDFSALTLVESIDAVEATYASYFIDGATVYMHSRDDLTPNNQQQVLVGGKFALRALFSGTGEVMLFENIDFVGGFQMEGNGTVLFHNCTFQHGSEQGNFRNIGGRSIIQKSISSNAVNDGFAYYTDARGIEIDCIGRYNGIESGTDNGSTAHSGAKIIRVNGHYHHVAGPVVADVQDGAESWNLGCIANDSTIGSAGFKCADGFAAMWLDNCTGSVRVNATARMYTHDCIIDSTIIEDDGTIVEY